MSISWNQDRMGSVTLTDDETGDTLFIQGEEGADLADMLDNCPDEEAQQHILSEYRACIESWDPPERDSE